jgi:hypothetical protein
MRGGKAQPDRLPHISAGLNRRQKFSAYNH